MVERENASGIQCPVDARLWGKEKGLSRPYPVVCHLLDTAAAFGALWDVLPSAAVRQQVADALGVGVAEARMVLSFWAGLHDLGKITPPFQAQVPRAFTGVREDPGYRFAPGAEGDRGFRHEEATHWALTELLAEIGYPEGRRTRSGQLLRGAVGHQVAQLLGGHHGWFGTVLKEREVLQASAYRPGLGEDGWDAQRRAHFDEVRRVTGAIAVPQGGLPPELAVVVAGLIVVADWLASQEGAIEALMPPHGWQGTGNEIDAHWQAACKAAPALVAEAGLGRARFEAERFADMFAFSPNALQADLAEHLSPLVEKRGAGLLLVTAPTGDGKTEAALFGASVLGRAAGARGLYFALPTMATADAMYPRVKKFAEQALAGERALTLLHSMAWLSPAYNGDGRSTGAPGPGGGVSADTDTATAAGTWLRGPKRGLLAPLSTGTIDQALSGVLPLRYNVLRLLGLSDKVFVVDEAHAYGPWMHQLLTRLLEWLGAFGAPVVLLSATLTGRTATSLVDAYRRGAGFGNPAPVEPRYPGWLFTDAATGAVSDPREVATSRPRTLDVSARKVFWDTADAPDSPVHPEGRRAALRTELRPVVEDGGTALVCCTTVAEAQHTYRDLHAAFPELAAHEGGLRLLHSRYPANARQEITAECQSVYGKPRDSRDTAQPRPASVLIATQVVEQSLDFDFDLVVSDLAPLAQLLQRAGRGRRHERGPKGRPSWAFPEDRPRLVVLDPFFGEDTEATPRSWGTVYDAGLLKRTSLLLAAETEGIAVPGDVQRLVDAVYAEDFADGLDEAVRQELSRLDAERQAGELAEEQLAAMVGICAPADVAGDLHRLSDKKPGVTEELLTTRLGADTGRVLCLYEQDNGKLTLDEAGALRIPEGGRRGPSHTELAQIMAHVAPVPGRWLRGDATGHPAPKSWDKQLLLRVLVLLRMRRDGVVWRCKHGDRTITTSEIGLEST